MLITVKTTKKVKEIKFDENGKKKEIEILYANFGVPVPKRSTHIVNHTKRQVSKIVKKYDNSYGVSPEYSFDEMDACELVNTNKTSDYDSVNDRIREKNGFASEVMCVDLENKIIEITQQEAREVKKNPDKSHKMIEKLNDLIVKEIKRELKISFTHLKMMMLEQQYQVLYDNEDLNFYDLINNLEIKVK